jgi:hypothetical protein
MFGQRDWARRAQTKSALSRSACSVVSKARMIPSSASDWKSGSWKWVLVSCSDRLSATAARLERLGDRLARFVLVHVAGGARGSLLGAEALADQTGELDASPDYQGENDDGFHTAFVPPSRDATVAIT